MIRKICGYRDCLVKHALKLTKCKEKAEDLSHTTILKALENSHKFTDNGDNKLLPWLKVVQKHIFINQYRKEPVIYGEDYLQGVLENEPSEYGIEQDSLTNNLEFEPETVRILNTYLNNKERIIIRLKYYHSLKYKEIANSLNYPEGTVKSILHKALRKLKKSNLFNNDLSPDGVI